MSIEPHDDGTIACTLSAGQMEAQLAEWADLADAAVSVTRDRGHLRLVLPICARERVEDLAARERACCSFLRIAVEDDDHSGTVTVTVDSPTEPADEVVSFIGRRP